MQMPPAVRAASPNIFHFSSHRSQPPDSNHTAKQKEIPKATRNEIKTFVKEHIRGLQSDPGGGNALALIVEAWNNAPHRLISLWDMTKFVGDELISVLSKLKRYQKRAAAAVAQHGRASDASDAERNELDDFLVKTVSKLCRKLSLVEADGRCLGLAHNLIEISLFPHLSHEVIRHDLSELRRAIKFELRSKNFTFIPPSKLEFFERGDLFGDAVNKKFPEAVPEIKEAGNCLAVGLYTAAVFHLMRVAERGLHFLANDVGAWQNRLFPLEFSDWHKVIEATGEKLKPLATQADSATRGTKKDQQLEYYRGLLDSLTFFRDAFRNPVSHLRGNYNEHEAMNVCWRVRDFMQRLASLVPLA
jgi:hypothetical protein